MKKALFHSLVVLLIIALSLACGWAYTAVCDRIDRKKYPCLYEEYVQSYSVRFGVPEHIIYAVIKVESDFSSNAVSSVGAIGLMQLMPDTFDWVKMKLGEEGTSALLYDPETNIRYGTFYLSYLKTRYGVWTTAFAAYNAGFGRVDEWLDNPDYVDQNGILLDTPFAETTAYMKKINKTIEIYDRLYPASPDSQ
ncbi:MAG: lytic transglycosylase domain-containing protein [Clostridia bacterium]|nr:lytic transglycosylase domain-containing protein [Clostridia bacterium]